MNNYLNQWISIIEGMVNSNTFKVMWEKAIINVLEDEGSTITFVFLHRPRNPYYSGMLLNSKASLNTRKNIIK
jgi:hypothetical protein